MERPMNENSSPRNPRWRKVVYGGMQHGFDDNHTDKSFIEDMITNANVVKRDMLKVILDSLSISQYICIVSLVVLVWTLTLNSSMNEHSLLVLNAILLAFGFSILLLTSNIHLSHALKLLFFMIGLYMLSPIYHRLTLSISSDSIWALTASLLIINLFAHNYSGNPTLVSHISLNASIVASLLIASRLPSRLMVFAVVMFSMQHFLFAPLVMYCVKKHSFRLYVWVCVGLMVVTLGLVYRFNTTLFGLLVGVFVFVNLVCPYWLIRLQEYKFEIKGPWDEAKLCFAITD